MSEEDIQEYHNIGKAIKKSEKYKYINGIQSTDHGSRIYDVAGYRLPSVTTILGRTKDQQFLKDWIAKKGEAEAERIKNHSSKRGTSMHKFLESHITGKGYDDLSPIGEESRPMAHKIIEIGLAPVDEYFGSEISLYYPGLYAGSTDLVCLHNGQEAIVDFKQSNKPKRKEWIEDYFMQLGAYAMAHNCVYDTQITQGVILMCTPDKYFQKFQIKGKEFIKYQHKFLERLDKYYNDKNKATS